MLGWSESTYESSIATTALKPEELITTLASLARACIIATGSSAVEGADCLPPRSSDGCSLRGREESSAGMSHPGRASEASGGGAGISRTSSKLTCCGSEGGARGASECLL